MFNFQYVWFHFLDLNNFLLLQLIFVFTSSLKQLISRRAFIPFQVLTMHLKDCLRSAVFQLWREYLKLNKFDKFIFYLLDQDLLNLFWRTKLIGLVYLKSSRQNAIKDHTIEWIEKHYPGVFQEIHFGNHFALDGQSRPKSEICR